MPVTQPNLRLKVGMESPVKTPDERCPLCGLPLNNGQMKYELDWRGPAGERPFRFHLWCHAMWQADLLRRLGPP
jgi:hypothetical protein